MSKNYIKIKKGSFLISYRLNIPLFPTRCIWTMFEEVSENEPMHTTLRNKDSLETKVWVFFKRTKARETNNCYWLLWLLDTLHM